LKILREFREIFVAFPKFPQEVFPDVSGAFDPICVIAFTTSIITGSLVNLSNRLTIVSEASNVVIKMSLVSPVVASQSSLTVQLLPSCRFASRGCPSHCRLNLSATTLSLPGTWRTSIILCASIPSHHRVCAALRRLFMSTSFNAWQSVSISTGKPQMISENLSRPYFSAANSNKKGLYLCSAADVRFDANAIRRSLSVCFPDRFSVWTLCDRTAAKPSWQLSEVTTGEPSYRGACRIGLDTKAVFRSRKALLCSSPHHSASLKSRSMHRYVAFE